MQHRDDGGEAAADGARAADDAGVARLAEALDGCGQAELLALVPALARLIARHGSLTDAWISPQVYAAFQAHGVHVVRNHYYGVLLDTRALPEHHWPGPVYAEPFARVRQAPYLPLLEAALAYRTELAGTPRAPGAGFHWDNGMIPPLDAVVYYGLVRALAPRRLVEIGSGFSTMLAVRAARATGTRITCIEPYPSAELIGLEPALAELRRVRIEEVDPAAFETLEAGDVLFIDTTHTVKLGSDVNHLLFNVLPRLRPGVVVHVHDVFLPFEYPRGWARDIGIMWNEQYALLAYLMDNPGYEVILPNHLASREQSARLADAFAMFDLAGITQNMGGTNGASFWLRRL